MNDETTAGTGRTRRPWSTKKKDKAPRGVFRHASGVWAVRFFCGAGDLHRERVGPLKTEAVRIYHERRGRAQREPGWCPTLERARGREQAQAAQDREARRIIFRDFAAEYLAWAKLHHKGWETEASRIAAMQVTFGDTKLDALAPADLERFLDGLLSTRSQSTRNRYRTLLHAMLNRAVRHGLLTSNPVRGIGKFKEPEGRTLYLTQEDEEAVRKELAPEAMRVGRPTLDRRRGDMRPLFVVSVNTGLRWSEQTGLRWADVDFLTRLISVRQSKTGHSRQVPMNSVVRSVLLDLAGQRMHTDDPEEPVFRCSYTEPDKFFPAAVERARRALVDAGKDGGHLDGYTWHCNRHTFASRLVMAGVDLRSVQTLGGWRTLAMVQRYSHLAPAHLREAVERIVAVPLQRAPGAAELAQDYPASVSRMPGVS